jgi:peptidyl-tRNA hydrolase, PTH2 family
VTRVRQGRPLTCPTSFCSHLTSHPDCDGGLPLKQVILIVRGLKMRRGKEVAQGAHAAMAFLARQLRVEETAEPDAWAGTVELSYVEAAWLSGSFTKVVLQVADEAELREVCQ